MRDILYPDDVHIVCIHTSWSDKEPGQCDSLVKTSLTPKGQWMKRETVKGESKEKRRERGKERLDCLQGLQYTQCLVGAVGDLQPRLVIFSLSQLFEIFIRTPSAFLSFSER